MEKKRLHLRGLFNGLDSNKLFSCGHLLDQCGWLIKHRNRHRVLFPHWNNHPQNCSWQSQLWSYRDFFSFISLGNILTAEAYLRGFTLLIFFLLRFWQRIFHIFGENRFPGQVNNFLSSKSIFPYVWKHRSPFCPFERRLFWVSQSLGLCFIHHFIPIAKRISWHQGNVFWVNECVHALFACEGGFGYQPLGCEAKKTAANSQALENSMM